MSLGALNMDSAGQISWEFPTDVGTTPGTYELWVVDNMRGKISNTVYETVAP